jgi:hypothetical protein
MIIWFLPGFIAGAWTVGANLGAENLRRWRSWPLTLVFSLSGLIAFRAVFSELARKEIRPLNRDEDR